LRVGELLEVFVDELDVGLGGHSRARCD
jgi:hypothetical protein